MRRQIGKHLLILCIIALLAVMLFGCYLPSTGEPFTITNGDNIILKVGQSVQLEAEGESGEVSGVSWAYSGNCVAVSAGGFVTAQQEGITTITGYANGHNASTRIVVYSALTDITLSSSLSSVQVGEQATLSCAVTPAVLRNEVTYEIISGSNCASLEDNTIKAISSGSVTIVARIGEVQSNTVTLTITPSNLLNSITLTANKYTLTTGERAQLTATKAPSNAVGEVTYRIVSGNAALLGNEVTSSTTGTVVVEAVCGEVVSNSITISFTPQVVPQTVVRISLSASSVAMGGKVRLTYTVTPTTASGSIRYTITSGDSHATLVGNEITALSIGSVTINATYGNVTSNTVTLTITDITTDPYVNVNKNTFYANYTPAVSYKDSYYRSQHSLMSGSIAEQDQYPTTAAYQPKQGNMFVRNTYAYYTDNGNTYNIVNGYGEVVCKIYRGGAYVVLEEVAAYVFAFGDVPANYVSNKSTSPTSSPWGKYLRLNHSYFSGDTDRYPYEPVLPDIRGCGGELSYYEIDIGTTGTDCDPSYDTLPYNNGSTIERGAARIVYSRYDANGDSITDINERYLFYTYNHYNDFQEYLNYYGGWGGIFGNITGGGAISSRSNYNPTEYVEVARGDFVRLSNLPIFDSIQLSTSANDISKGGNKGAFGAFDFNLEGKCGKFVSLLSVNAKITAQPISQAVIPSPCALCAVSRANTSQKRYAA